MRPLPLLLPLAALLAAAPAAAQCTTSWTDPAGGDWSDPANWSDGVPGLDDGACITLAGTYTVVLDADASVRALLLGGPMGNRTLTVGPGRTLAVNAPSFVDAGSVLDWTGGTILTGAGSLHNAGLIRLTGNADKHLGVGGAATLFNQGTLAWAGGALRFGEGTVFQNSGLFDMQGDLFLNNFSTVAGVFRNMGTGVLRKSAGPSFSFFLAFVENHGVVESLSGSLQLGAGSTHIDARLEAAAGAEVLLYVGTHTVAGTLSGSPAGTVSFLQSELVAAPGGATLDFAGTGFEWAGGRIEGEHPITNAGLFRLTGGGQKEIRDDVVFTNEGAVAWGGGRLVLSAGATFVNEGLFDVQSDNPLEGVGVAAFVNTASGVYRKSGGAILNVVDVPFENAGALEAQRGTIYFTGGTTHTDATLAVAAGASVVFSGGTHRIEGTLSGSPVGRVSMPTGLGGVVEGGAPGATLALGGSGFLWEGGTFAGSLTNAGLLRLTGLGSKHLADTAALVNAGTVTWEGGPLTLGGGATLENAGLIDAQGDFSLEATGAGGLFVNAEMGRFRKSGGTTAGFVGRSVHFRNEAGGVISAESGMLAFFDLDHQAGALVQGTASFSSAAGFTHAGDAAPGPGLGTLTWYTDYAPASTSTLFVELGPVDHDRLEVGGAATLDGILHLDFPGLYAPRIGDAFEVLSAGGGTLSGTFAAVEAPVGFAFDVAYAPDGVAVAVAEEPGVIVSAAPEHTPFVIPAGGGDLRFAVRLTNTTAQAQAVDVWAEAVLPGGAVVPVRQRTLTLSPGATVTRYFRLHVPGNAPAGIYTMHLFAGAYPDGAGSADHFAFEKAEAPSREAVTDGSLAWRVAERGEDAAALVVADGEPAAAVAEALPAAVALHAATPNPFADRATLRYALPEAGPVRLAVYDVLGREVAVLVEGEREAGRHTAHLDGWALAAGVYVVRLMAGAKVFTQRVTRARW